jgi:hypothetical protein
MVTDKTRHCHKRQHYLYCQAEDVEHARQQAASLSTRGKKRERKGRREEGGREGGREGEREKVGSVLNLARYELDLKHQRCCAHTHAHKHKHTHTHTTPTHTLTQLLTFSVHSISNTRSGHFMVYVRVRECSCTRV